jgi:hypothetical protein
MKFLDLDNLQKYFSMADEPYYKLQYFTGNICEVAGVVLNTLSDEVFKFYLKINRDDTITFKLNNKTRLLQ